MCRSSLQRAINKLIFDSPLPVELSAASPLNSAAVFGHLGRVLAPQVGLYDGREHDAHDQRPAGEDVGRRVAPLAEQPAVDQREGDAEDLRERVQDAGRGALSFRVGQFGAKFKPNWQVASHEKSATFQCFYKMYSIFKSNKSKKLNYHIFLIDFFYKNKKNKDVKYFNYKLL